jgi:hypothetical protein
MSDAARLRNAPSWVTALLALIAVVLILLAVIYFAEPAGSMPSFMPGHAAGSTHHHTTHGIACLILGVVALVGAWMSAGRKKSL